MEFTDAVDLARNSLVCLYLNDRSKDEDAWDVASGVLVRLGDATFILTAGHNLRGLATRDVFTMYPRHGLVLPWRGGLGIRKLAFLNEPDVGVIELDEAESAYWRHMAPLGEADFDDIPAAESGDVLILFGFPSARTRVDQMRADEDRRAPPFFASAALAARARINTQIRSPFEPPGGRGFHVVYHGETYFDPETGTPSPLPAPEGLSGGPLLAVSNTGVRLIGLARAKHGTTDAHEWCEPAFEALVPLLEHGNEQVRSAARRVIQHLRKAD